MFVERLNFVVVREIIAANEWISCPGGIITSVCDAPFTTSFSHSLNYVSIVIVIAFIQKMLILSPALTTNYDRRRIK